MNQFELFSNESNRSSYQKRQMDGALSRVPANFYEHVWSILERTPNGIRLCNILLPQVNR